MSPGFVVRAVEIMLDRQTALAAAMTAPEVLIEPELGDMGLRDFQRVDDAIAAGRRAAEAGLPGLMRLLESAPATPATGERVLQLRYDPVCAMVINPGRARATATWTGRTYYFCSENCRDGFERNPRTYLEGAQLALGGSARKTPRAAETRQRRKE